MKYLIGIDLGTTNTVVYYLNASREDSEPKLFMIPQVTEQGEIEEKPVLPSFVFLPDENDVQEKALALPWNEKIDYCVGELAKKNAPSLPLKVIASTKSWLCSENIDRTAAVLPWNRNNPEKQLSPVEASKRILEHVKNAWNHKIAKGNEDEKFENQNVTLTVPASFDAVARELTIKAAEEAGLSVVLLEEPLAAFYAWLNESGEGWRKEIKPEDVILVCDIGGGTSDYSLVKVVDDCGNLSFERIAVGRHILLGGDNMDLTLAYTVAAKLQAEKNIKLDSYQIAGLTHACRQAKETLMNNLDAPSQKLTVLGRGSSVIGGAVTAELAREEMANVLIDGFFPSCSLEDKPAEARKAGLRSFGLSYESDPAVTKHLAEFLSLHCAGNEIFPSCVLFNGGVTKSAAIRERIIKTLKSWQPEGSEELKVISGTDPDQAVARGGCYYANVKEGKGIRIKAGSSHAYYIGVESSMPAVPGFEPPLQGLCFAPFGMEEGADSDIPYTGLGLIVGETTEFRVFASTSRKDDGFGDIEELPALSASLPAKEGVPPGSLIPVMLRSVLTETGTLQIWCVSEDRKSEWKLEFELRSEEQ